MNNGGDKGEATKNNDELRRCEQMQKYGPLLLFLFTLPTFVLKKIK